MSIDLFALDEIAQLREHFILLNGSPEAISVLLDDSITPASFATWLAIAGKPALFEQLIASTAGAVAVAVNAKSMAAVAASSIAMKAVADSSTAMAAVADSSTAMAAVADSSTALDAIFANNEAKVEFKASTALTVAMVPAMTSASTPSGVASASTEYDANVAGWKAFNRIPTTMWTCAYQNVSNQWIKYAFPSAVYIHTCSLKGGAANSQSPKNFRVEYSDDNATWTSALSAVNPADVLLHDYDVIHAGKHRYWRIFIVNNNGYADYVSVETLQFAGFN